MRIKWPWVRGEEMVWVPLPSGGAVWAEDVEGPPYPGKVLKVRGDAVPGEAQAAAQKERRVRRAWNFYREPDEFDRYHFRRGITGFSGPVSSFREYLASWR